MKMVASAAMASHSLASDDDETTLAKLGYKQELKRNFTMIEVFGIAFSIMGLLPSIASTLAYSIPAGPVGMVWYVLHISESSPMIFTIRMHNRSSCCYPFECLIFLSKLFNT